MDDELTQIILEATQAKSIGEIETIQPLWNNYGYLLRIGLRGSSFKSVILKHIKIPENNSHPKGFSGDISNQRKIRSYEVETHWYNAFNDTNLRDTHSKTARCIKSFRRANEFFLLLEDLKQQGFLPISHPATMDDAKTALKWLANFHCKFINKQPTGLWQSGTYWHLETRPDELKRLSEKNLATFAPLINQRLNNAKFKTIVHGDAKIANFCFSEDRQKAAAVDFQYTGGGCGMKDVAYFVGSCLAEDICEQQEEEILDFYFLQLRRNRANSNVDLISLEKEWRILYHFAWADFHRFLKGWSPGHWKINSYSERIVKRVISEISDDLTSNAIKASISATNTIMTFWQKDIKTLRKDGESEASSIVTQADIDSQEAILKELELVSKAYDIGLLTEESQDNLSRHEKDFFWAIDPLDGTIFFKEGQSGFAVSIALVAKSGKPLLGVVSEPLANKVFHCIKNSETWFEFADAPTSEPNSNLAASNKPILFADRSLQNQCNTKQLQKFFNLHYTGGAVANCLHVIQTPNSCYFKPPKPQKGGCAIWDLAGVALLAESRGLKLTGFNSEELNFNSPKSLYFNETGLMLCHDSSLREKIKEAYHLSVS